MKRLHQRKIVDIGHGERPAFIQFPSIAKERGIYIGMDLGSHRRIQFEGIRRSIIQAHTTDFVTAAIKIDSTGRLPILDRAIDEVHLHDILSYSGISFERKVELMHETARMLRIGGILFATYSRDEIHMIGEINDVITQMPPHLQYIPREEVWDMTRSEESGLGREQLGRIIDRDNDIPRGFGNNTQLEVFVRK